MDINTISKRAQKILSTPRHVLEKNLTNLTKNKWLWDFTLEKIELHELGSSLQSDKILTLSYFNISGNLPELLFLETLSRIVIEKDISFLQRLSFRELESYLRDENHLPAFGNSNDLLMEESFKAVKDSLLATIIIKEIKEKAGWTPNLVGWRQLTLVEKNLWAHSFIEHVNKLFSRAKPLQLVLAEEKELAVLMKDFPVSVEVLEEIINQSFGDFGNTEKISSLKVVAVQ